ncbi:MAG: CDP-alcohol phosphatidyltransferase family protein [Acidimicrobiia bacterium]|nr:CDP-alcohol phosphatidyltransferase family protein [Acidimicrobiia bacterium]
MFDGSLRTAFDRLVAPVGRGLQRLGVSPDVVTIVGVLMAGACGVAIGTGRFFTAAVLLALTGFPDALDGAVAKAGGRAGPRGAFLDSVSDRLSDGLLFAGAGWYFVGTDSPRLAMLPFGLFISASLVSYQRAKAESLGFEAKGGLMERAERFIALGFGLVFSPLFVATLWIMLILTTATAVHRFVKVWKQAGGEQPPTPLRAGRTRRRTRRPVSDFRRRAQTRAENRRRSPNR